MRINFTLFCFLLSSYRHNAPTHCDLVGNAIKVLLKTYEKIVNAARNGGVLFIMRALKKVVVVATPWVAWHAKGVQLHKM